MRDSNSVNWFEIYVQDMPRARGFYESVFEVTLDTLLAPGPDAPGLEMLSFPGKIERYGANGALVRMPGVPSGPGGTLVYFACEECSAAGARVVAGGGKVHREKMSIGEYGFIVLALDTEGNMIGLHSMQ